MTSNPNCPLCTNEMSVAKNCCKVYWRCVKCGHKEVA